MEPVDRKELEAMVRKFKDQYDEVYLTELEDEDFIWRTLGRKEYREIVAYANDENDAFERICDLCILYPRYDYINNGRAYLPTQLAPEILNESGFGTYSKDLFLLDNFRSEMNSFEAQCEVIIKTAFPDITFEEMENWTREKLIKFLARAEWQLTTLRGVPIELGGKEEAGEGEKEELDIASLSKSLREQGQDPMFVLRGLYQKPEPHYVERPLIGGHQQEDTMLAGINAWRMEETPDGRYDIIRKQVQKISRR